MNSNFFENNNFEDTSIIFRLIVFGFLVFMIVLPIWSILTSSKNLVQYNQLNNNQMIL